jgi:hypothetical protein
MDTNPTDKQRGSKGHGNLKPWSKGQSGNPKGRKPASECMADWIRRLADETDTSGMSKGQLVAEAVYAAALSGDMTACRIILDRIEPLPGRSVTIQNNVGAAGLAAIESMRGNPETFRAMLRANGCELPPTGECE